MEYETMSLKVLLPFGVFMKKEGVKRIVAETIMGSYGFLPNRLDCVGALVPGILTYETEEEGETYIAIDEGLIRKTNNQVIVTVRRAIKGMELGKLHEAVQKEFLQLDDREKHVRTVLTRLEIGFIRQFQKLQQ